VVMLRLVFLILLFLNNSIRFYFRNILTTKDVVGNVIHVVTLLYLMKQHVLLVHLAFGLMVIIQVNRDKSVFRLFDFFKI
jgi:hypothetical protein